MSFHLRHTDIRIQAERAWLDALLSHAPDVRGLVVCAQPYINNLRESREYHAAAILRQAGFATLVLSLLTPQEEQRDPDLRFDVAQLVHRLLAVLTWAEQQPDLAGLPVGLLGDDTAIAAAVRLAAREPGHLEALVSRCGRIDLVGGEPLRRLMTPLLVLAPGEGSVSPQSARTAYDCVGGEKAWQALEGVSDGLAEAGAMEAAARAACTWFQQHLPERDGDDPVAD
ncbi:MAG: alpha/beta hydrolase [Candidatus Dactylopiibacterium carminicum]|uniref:Alpha/beta hydrolase n=1 Tax=Candidatus Dactylopiibacterium carminicum TaxID=857335 RepID=A0A272EZ24_9RHOO|nr:alpha/beta hydrolase [Candidatus Dactylopiibacterium carminicum]KAF7600862.1 alpha/beta hydrolase [Candidatus Dactylopiibacterium carminicum]PAS95361.1 MAG: alpha/beta hydrolase [Candidatus Dactylopiibacterium carminicum]PAS98628.1 MAG: alpha/beta hydrolase [Candidatus Dactylopiibacterium carminicum]PAT00864.1 MAG: hypothetical protein BSR46_00500 [Candidatus Dactylopiibacterium carminicum]